MSAINKRAAYFQKQLYIMVMKWKQENRGKFPRYVFLSKDAFELLNVDHRMDITNNLKYMGIDIAFVAVPGVYAGVGEDF